MEFVSNTGQIIGLQVKMKQSRSPEKKINFQINISYLDI